MIILATLTLLLITFKVLKDTFRADVKEAKEDLEKVKTLIAFNRVLEDYSEQYQSTSNITFITIKEEERKDMKLNIQLFAKRIQY